MLVVAPDKVTGPAKEAAPVTVYVPPPLRATGPVPVCVRAPEMELRAPLKERAALLFKMTGPAFVVVRAPSTAIDPPVSWMPLAALVFKAPV